MAKMGTGEEFINSQIQILRLFCMLDPKPGTPYQHAQMCNLLQVVSFQLACSPVFDMVSEHPELINEERGELSFAVMARRLAGDPARVDVDKASDMYVAT